MKLCLVTPRLPPEKCGVGDYTWGLAQELARSHEVFLLTRQDQTATVDGERLRVLAEVPGWNLSGICALRRGIMRLEPSWVGLQYVPFLYHRVGLNPWLPLMAIWLRLSGVRIVLHVHEPFVAMDTVKHVAMGLAQRVALMLLISGSRKIAVTTTAWCDTLRAWFWWRKDDIFWLPAGSNIPRVECREEQRQVLRTELGLAPDDVLLAVINPFGAGKLFRFVCAAWERLRSHAPGTRLLVIGLDGEEAVQMDGNAPRGPGVLYAGYLEPAGVSRLLSCADLFLCPFDDGMSARRTSVISAMEHGLPVVTTRGHLTDPDLFDGSPLVLTAVDDPDEFCDAAEALAKAPASRRAVGMKTQEFFASHFTWPRIASRLLAELAR